MHIVTFQNIVVYMLTLFTLTRAHTGTYDCKMKQGKINNFIHEREREKYQHESSLQQTKR